MKRYGEELQSVFDELIRMASYAVGAVRKAQAALERGDAAEAKNIVEGDENVNRFEKEIEQRALRIIIKYQPVANDLRDVTGALKMITDIERIGDQAADIAEIVSNLKDEAYIKRLTHTVRMGRLAVRMVHDGVASFINGDEALADETIARDDEMDALFLTVKNELVELIKKDSSNADQAIMFMMIAKYLERIGDHAVNV